ncbi:MAG: molecular chaperone TorD family protein [Dehalococcoidia bacterium]|nr:molecular chaperone TorD family protein [Dehalococcoidia bacterium]
MARLRQAAYRFVSVLLLDPNEERLNAARDAARYLGRTYRQASGLAFYKSWHTLLREVGALGPLQISDIQKAYCSLFVGSSARSPVPLHESPYLDPRGMAPGKVLVQVEAQYTAAGLRSSPSVETPDHVATEMEFVSFLCGKEAEAWRSVDVNQALDLLSRQKTFLEAHLFRWLPFLENAVARRDRDGFYAEVIRASWALIAHDVDMTGFLISRLREAVKVH